jgi:hypothetical protein
LREREWPTDCGTERRQAMIQTGLLLQTGIQ